MKKYAFFDLDNTLFDGYTTSEFCLFLAERKLVPQSIISRYRKCRDLFYKREIDYRKACEEFIIIGANALAGQDEKTANAWAELFLKEEGSFFPWVKELLKILKKKEYDFFIVSATINPFAHAIKEHLGIENIYSSSLGIESGKYTGKVENFLHFDEKAKIIRNLMKGAKNCKKIGFGDSVGDIDMLSHMDVAFVCNPFEKEIIDVAKEKGWHVVNKDNIMETVKSLDL